MNKTLAISALCFAIFAGVGFKLRNAKSNVGRHSRPVLASESSPNSDGFGFMHPSRKTGTIILGGGTLSLAQLRLTVADVTRWQQASDRTKVIRESLRQHARTRGGGLALQDACEVFAIPTLPEFLAESGLKLAAISCLEAGGITDAELAEVLSRNPAASRPLLRAFALFSEPRTVGAVYTKLKTILDLSDSKSDPRLNQLILEISVRSAASCSQSDLASILEIARDHLDEDAAVSRIAVVAYAYNREMALQFLREQSARYPKRLAKFVRELELPPEELAAFCDALSASALASFISGYARQLEDSNPRLYAELAAAVEPLKVPEDVRMQVITGLLRAGGGEASAWLETLSMKERAATMSSTYDFMIKQPRFDGRLTKTWLEAVSEINGIGETQLVSAIRASALHMDWETILQYTKKLSPKLRNTVEANLYLTEASKIAFSGDRQTLFSFLDSAPVAMKPSLLGYVAATVATQSPERALQWYNETTDLAAKRALEEAMMNSPNLTMIPMETRRTWLEDRIKDSAYLRQGSRAVNNYARDLGARDASAAIAFVKALPPSPLSDDAFKSLARDWAYQDPISASQWIVELPSGRGRDFALAELTKASRNEPESAFINIAAISDSKLRMDAANAVVNWWKARDAEKMRTLIGQSGLASEEKLGLLQALEK